MPVIRRNRVLREDENHSAIGSMPAHRCEKIDRIEKSNLGSEELYRSRGRRKERRSFNNKLDQNDLTRIKILGQRAT